MHPYRVVILDRAALPDAVTIGDFKFPHTLDVYQSTDDRSAAERIADADIVITNKVMLRHEAIAAAKRLKLVAVAATGTDNIDVESCRERDIEVHNVRGYANHAVATLPAHLRLDHPDRSGSGELSLTHRSDRPRGRRNHV